MPTISLIAAMSENRVIGKNNRVPWKIKEDLLRLKKLTQNQTVIIGRKTYDSMVEYYNKSGRPMPGKKYIVITHNITYTPPGCGSLTPMEYTVVNSLEKAIEAAKRQKTKEIFIIGGAQIFSQALPLADKLYLTIVKGNFEGDAFFPDYPDFKKIISSVEKSSDKYSYKFLELKK